MLGNALSSVSFSNIFKKRAYTPEPRTLKFQRTSCLKSMWPFSFSEPATALKMKTLYFMFLVLSRTGKERRSSWPLAKGSSQFFKWKLMSSTQQLAYVLIRFAQPNVKYFLFTLTLNLIKITQYLMGGLLRQSNNSLY